MNDALVPTVVSLSAVLLSATVGLVLRYRSSAKPAPGATLLKEEEEEATPAAPEAAELDETVVSLAEEGEGRRPRVTTREQRGDHPLLGSRVEFHGLQKAAPLNGSYGVVLRRESAGRFAVRKEIAGADEAASVMVKASNLRAAPPLDSLAAVQRLVDAAPAGARVTLPRGEVPLRARAASEPTAEPRRAVDVESDADAADQAEAGDQVEEVEAAEGGTQGGTLLLSRALTLAGMGCRSGGTVLHFGVTVGPEVPPVPYIQPRQMAHPIRGMHVHGYQVEPCELRLLWLCSLGRSSSGGGRATRALWLPRQRSDRHLALGPAAAAPHQAIGAGATGRTRRAPGRDRPVPTARGRGACAAADGRVLGARRQRGCPDQRGGLHAARLPRDARCLLRGAGKRALHHRGLHHRRLCEEWPRCGHSGTRGVHAAAAERIQREPRAEGLQRQRVPGILPRRLQRLPGPVHLRCHAGVCQGGRCDGTLGPAGAGHMAAAVPLASGCTSWCAMETKVRERGTACACSGQPGARGAWGPVRRGPTSDECSRRVLGISATLTPENGPALKREGLACTSLTLDARHSKRLKSKS